MRRLLLFLAVPYGLPFAAPPDLWLRLLVLTNNVTASTDILRYSETASPLWEASGLEGGNIAGYQPTDDSVGTGAAGIIGLFPAEAVTEAPPKSLEVGFFTDQRSAAALQIGLLKHVTLAKFEAATTASQKEALVAAYESMADRLPGVKSVVAGLNQVSTEPVDSAAQYDMGIVFGFDSLAAYKDWEKSEELKAWVDEYYHGVAPGHEEVTFLVL